MYTIICIDDRNGTFFCGKRQSRDALLVADVLAMTEGKVLRIAPYSRLLFEENALVSENFLEMAGPGEYCFCEGNALLPYLGRIEGVILYHWNRCYPSDRKLDLIPAEHGFRLTETVEFPGKSHDKITKEVYLK